MKDYKEQLKSLVRQMLDDENTTFYMDDVYPFAKTEDGIYMQLLGDDISLRDFVRVGKEYAKYTTRAKETISDKERERKIKKLQRQIDFLNKKGE